MSRGLHNIKERITKAVFILALIVFLGALGYLGFIWFSYHSAEKGYEQLSEQVVQREEASPSGDGEETGNEEAAWAPLTVDFSALKAVSEDAVLWIDIPGTGVSYPVAQAEDNDYYLRRKLNGDNSFAGTVFMDYRNDPAVADDNTILYGHNMRNGSMFGLLKKYGKEEFFLAHPEIDLYLPDRILRCTVISSHQEEAQEENFPMNFESGEEKLAYIDRMKSKAWYDTGISAGEEDRLITLVTCTGNGYSHRFVVQAVVTEEIETASDGVSEALEEKP